MRLPRTLVVAATLLALGSGAACSGGDPVDGAGGPPRVGDTVPTLRSLEDGSRVAWFAAPSLAGDTVSIADLRGSPVLLNLWATWCPPCRHETPFLQSVHERYDGALRTVGVTVDGKASLDQVRAFLEGAGVTYEVLHDPGMRSMDLFGVPGLPGTFLLDREGVVRFARIGPVAEGDKAFEDALAVVMESTDGPPGAGEEAPTEPTEDG